MFLFGYGKLKINEETKRRQVGSEIARQKAQNEKNLTESYIATVKINMLLIKMAHFKTNFRFHFHF